MRAAQDNFFGTYNVMVAKAQLKGRQQEFYTPPLQLEHKEPEHTPVSNDEAQKHLKSLMERLKSMVVNLHQFKNLRQRKRA